MTRERLILRLFTVGRIRPGPEAALFERYGTRIRPGLALTEIAETRGTAGLLAALPGNAIIVALDEGGETVDSVGFAAMLQRWHETARPVCFVIGAADGLSGDVIARADTILSLGSMTWPHLLVRAMLAEQIYRAQTILAGHPYHRVGRNLENK